MDMVLVAGAAAGLIMGSFGYVLARFWAKPILAYQSLKKRLARLLTKAADEDTMAAEAGDTLRRSAMELQKLVDEVLPQWYALALEKKGERPGEAVRHLQTLANCTSPEAAQRRIAAVQESLKLR